MDLQVFVFVDIDGVVVGVVGKHNVRVANLTTALNHLRPKGAFVFVTVDHRLQPLVAYRHRVGQPLNRVALGTDIKKFFGVRVLNR